MMDLDTVAPVVPPSLWRNHDFTKLWAGQTVSLFGTLLARIALPFVAVLLLHASPAQMAVLTALNVAPAIALGLIAGHLVDRLSRRWVMIAADAGRALVPLWIPFAYLAHSLRLEHLYVVATLMSVLAVFFDVAYPAYVPALVGREQLLAGNTRLEASAAVSEVAGFSLAGVITQALSAPMAMIVDSATYVVSAISLLFIRTPEPARAKSASDDEAPKPSEVWEGLRSVVRQPLRLALAGSDALTGLVQGMTSVVFMIFTVRVLALHPAELGVVFGVGGIASFAGALLVTRLTVRFGVGRTIMVAAAIAALGFGLVPLARGPEWVLIVFLVVPQLTDGPATISMISRNTLLQAITPDGIQGRVQGAVRAVGSIASVLGIAFGGLLGTVIGARNTLFVALGVEVGIVFVLALSPVRRVRAMPVTALE